MRSHAALLTGLFEVYSPETAIVSSWHLHADSLKDSSVPTKYKHRIYCRIRMFFSMRERGWVLPYKKCVCIHTYLIHIHVHVCILQEELWQVYSFLKQFVPPLHPPWLPLETTLAHWRLVCLRLYLYCMILGAGFLVPCLCLTRKQRAPLQA